MFLLLGISAAASAGVERAPLNEFAGKGEAASGEWPQRGTFDVDYSDTTVGGPTFNRPLSDCNSLSGVGTNTPFHVQPFTVGGAGNYSVDSVQNSWDGFIHVYENEFNPAAPLTNCIAGNDDGPGGIGTSLIASVALSAGVNYFVVTSGFGNIDSGTFTNTISGPAPINLGGGLTVDISKTAPGGVVFGAPYTYLIQVDNNNGEAVEVTLTDVLPAGVAYVGDDCAGGVAGGTWSTVLNLAAGASVSCALEVDIGQTCIGVTNSVTASVTGGGSSASATSNEVEAVADGGFEGGSPNAAWTEASSNFGSPLCTAGGCGVGGGTGPRSGSWWLWFGGFGGGTETASMEQSVTIVESAQFLEFWLETPVCSDVNGASDFARALIDGNEVWRVDANAASCDALGYQPVVIDISPFADGGTHLLRFESTTVGGDVSNFFIDDVSISSADCVAGTVAPPIPVAQPVPSTRVGGLILLGSLLLVLGFVVQRRRIH